MRKNILIIFILLMAFTVTYGFAQMGGGHGGGMMGGQHEQPSSMQGEMGKGQMMEHKGMMEHGQMMNGMVDMMQQMSGMMHDMEENMGNMPKEKMLNMSKMMKEMSSHMVKMSGIMEKGMATEKDMKMLHDEMMRMENVRDGEREIG